MLFLTEKRPSNIQTSNDDTITIMNNIESNKVQNHVIYIFMESFSFVFGGSKYFLKHSKGFWLYHLRLNLRTSPSSQSFSVGVWNYNTNYN